MPLFNGCVFSEFILILPIGCLAQHLYIFKIKGKLVCFEIWAKEISFDVYSHEHFGEYFLLFSGFNNLLRRDMRKSFPAYTVNRSELSCLCLCTKEEKRKKKKALIIPRWEAGWPESTFFATQYRNKSCDISTVVWRILILVFKDLKRIFKAFILSQAHTNKQLRSSFWLTEHTMWKLCRINVGSSSATELCYKLNA